MRLLWIGAVLALLALAAGCDGPLNPTPDGGTLDVTCDQDAGVLTLTEMHPQVMGVICADCHKPGVVDPDMSTVDATYANVVGQVSLRYGGQGLKIVDPGHLATSLMWLKVNGGSPRLKGPNGELIGGQMPNGRPPLADDKKALIKQWICSGAPK